MPYPLKKFLSISIIFFLIFNTIYIVKCAASESEKISDFPATGFFYVAKKNGIWWFINPDGEKFYSIGVSAVDSPIFCYDIETDFVKNTSERLKIWNINTVMGNTGSFTNFPWVARFRWKHLSYMHDPGWNHDRFPDVFDTWWQSVVNTSAMKYASLLKDDQNLIGYFTDNEMKWGPDTLDRLNLLDVYVAAENTTAGKKRVVDFLRSRYTDINFFNIVWNLNITNFDELLNINKLGVNESWRLRSRNIVDIISIKREYPYFVNQYYFNTAKSDIVDFSALVAEKYFNITDSAIKKADPNHLNLGVRYHLLGVPEEVLVASGKYIDVVSINYYRSFVKVYDPTWRNLGNKFDCVPLDNFMEKYSTIIDKPIYISEYGFYPNDGSVPLDLENISPTKPAFSEEERYKIYEWYARNCFKSRYVIGLAWFFFSDEYGIFRGLVDLWNEPHKIFCEKMSNINSKAMIMHENPVNKIPNFFPFFINYNKFGYFSYISKVLLGAISNKNSASIFSRLNKNEKITRDVCEDSIIQNYDILVGNNSISDYSSIQKAIDNASNGDTIFVLSGLYKEKIVIDKSIKLIGSSAKNTTISGFYQDNIFTNDVPETNFVVTIKSDNVTFRGFNITSHGAYSDSSKNFRACAGVKIRNNKNIILSDNIFYKLGGYGGGGGILALKTSNILISNNSFNNVGGVGLVVDSVNNSIIMNNNFIDNSIYGIWLSQLNEVNIYNNLIEGSEFGIAISKATNTTLDKNIFQDNNQKCLVLRSSTNNKIINNRFVKTTPDLLNNKFDSVMFFYEKGNYWQGNYWFKPKFIPKIIFGKIGCNNLKISFEYDLKPAIN